MSVRVRTFCFFIVALSTHGLSQHQTSGESARTMLGYSMVTKVSACEQPVVVVVVVFCAVAARLVEMRRR